MQQKASTVPGARYFSILDRLNRSVLGVVVALMAVMCCLALFQVATRLVLSDLGLVASAPWSEELGRFAMIWMIFLGSAYAVRTGQMIALRLLETYLPRRLRLLMNAVATCVVVGFAVLLIVVGLQIVDFGWRETSPVLQVQKAYVYLAMPVSATLIIVNSLSTFAETALRSAEPGGTSVDTGPGVF